MKKNLRYILSPVFCCGIFSIIAFSSYAQSPLIHVGGSAVLVSGDAKFPMWIPAGTTLACGTNVKSISVIEYLVTAGPTTGGVAQNIQQYNQLVTVTVVNPTNVSVPANRVWKIEGVMMDPAANSTPGSNYLAGTGLTLTGSTFSLTNPVPVNLGGTGLAALTTGRVLIGNGTGNVTLAGPTGANQVLRSTGTDAPVWGSLVSGDIPALGGTPALTLGTSNSAGSASTYIKTDATILAFDVTVPAALGTAAVGTATTAARRDHVHPAVNLGTGVGLTGTLPIGSGGTGSTTQNWVDLTTAQNPIAGAKTWTSTGAFTAAGTGLSVSNNATVGGTLGVTSNITNGGFDFILGNTDQLTRGSSGSSRALVKNAGSVLTINYAGDFTGGTQVNSNLDITGTIKVQGGSPGVGKVLTSDAAGLASWATPAGGSLTYLDVASLASTGVQYNTSFATKTSLAITAGTWFITFSAEVAGNSGFYGTDWPGYRFWDGTTNFARGWATVFYNGYWNTISHTVKVTYASTTTVYIDYASDIGYYGVYMRNARITALKVQ